VGVPGVHRSGLQDVVDRIEYALQTGMEGGVLDRHGLASGELVERLGEFVGHGHGCVVDEHGNHRVAAFQRSLDLQHHEVMGILELAPLTGAVLHVDPLRADDRDEHAALPDSLGDRADEVRAGLDRLDVEEDAVAPEPADEAIGDATGDVPVLSPVAQEDPTRCRGTDFPSWNRIGMVRPR